MVSTDGSSLGYGLIETAPNPGFAAKRTVSGSYFSLDLALDLSQVLVVANQIINLDMMKLTLKS